MRGTVTFPGITEAAVGAITAVLQRRGYRVTRSFDLQSALGYQVEHCPCPHHGTEECTCHYVVLLAYPPAAKGRMPPRVFTAHSYGAATQLSLLPDGEIEDGESIALVSALFEAALLLSPEEPVIEIQARVPGP